MEKSNGSTGTLYGYMSPGNVAESDLTGALKSEYVFFDGERVARKEEQRVLEILHGLNELHHTLSNQLVQYLTNGEYAYSADSFGRMLLEIVNQYRIGSLLDSAIEFAPIRSPLPNT